MTSQPLDAKAIRTKFVCETRSEHLDGTLTCVLRPIWDQETIEAAQASAGGGITGKIDHENPILYDRMPTKPIEWTFNNPTAFDIFLLGATYYLDVKLAQMPGEVASERMAQAGVGQSSMFEGRGA